MLFGKGESEARPSRSFRAEKRALDEVVSHILVLKCDCFASVMSVCTCCFCLL